MIDPISVPIVLKNTQLAINRVASHAPDRTAHDAQIHEHRSYHARFRYNKAPVITKLALPETR